MFCDPITTSISFANVHTDTVATPKALSAVQNIQMGDYGAQGWRKGRREKVPAAPALDL